MTWKSLSRFNYRHYYLGADLNGGDLGRITFASYSVSRYPECIIPSFLTDGSREDTRNMEGNENDVSCEKIFDAPKNTHKSTVWHYFGFFKREGKLDKTHVICKQCRIAIKYAGNTTNLATHMRRRHGVDPSAAAACSPSGSTGTPDIPSGTKACDNSRSITSFCGQNTHLAAEPALYLFCKDYQLCNAEENWGFQLHLHMFVQFIIEFTPIFPSPWTGLLNLNPLTAY